MVASQRQISLWSYVLRRAIQSIPVILGVIVINFLLIHLAPGDPLSVLVGESGATQEFVDSTRKAFGLDLPLYEQFFIYFSKVIQGDLGFSYFYKAPVLDIIASRIPATFFPLIRQSLGHFRSACSPVFSLIV